MAPKATKSPEPSELHPESPETTLMHSDIAALAYQLWQERGCPDGSAEEDWHKAVEQLQQERESRSALA